MKFLLSALFLALIATNLSAASDFVTLHDTSASSGLTITCNATSISGKRVSVYLMSGTSDLSTSVIQVLRANATGTTGNYTVVAKYKVGSGTTHHASYIGQVYVGDISYSYRFLLDSTTANSLVVTYKYE